MTERTNDGDPPSSGGAEAPGARLGPYKLLRQIGEGGFGVVFMAEQERPVVRKVALKIIKLGMDTRQVIARFEQERQALAVMDHPNIARVLDAGVTESGRPYFVMDFVQGEPISEYCDAHNLTIDERLDLFSQVCSAVQHAHVKGIIHRDLKPSNVLVATQDGRPVAKVIDFGIAKATSAKLTEKTVFTEMDQVIGTLEYMSPEQAEGSLDIDTRTDVYALGVLLYELLTGSTPFDAKALRSAMYSEAQRLIREVDPPKPSTRLSESLEKLATIAARRRVEPQRLGAILRGELDWIVMKALEKDRERRYESASALAEDVKRYLDGEAIVAAPPSATYRLRTFVRRHKGGVAAAAAVLAALLLGVAGFAWQAHRAGEQRDEAIEARRGEKVEREKAEALAKSESEQRSAAEKSEAKAKAISDFQLSMLNAANVRELGREAKVTDVLAGASAEVEKAFGDRPEVAAAVHHMLGSTYLSLGLLDEAEPHVRSALALSEPAGGQSPEMLARSLGDLGYLESERGDSEAAAETYARAVAAAERAAGPESQLVLGMRSDYANALGVLNRHEEAAEILKDVLAVRTRVAGRDERSTVMTMNSLAVMLHQLRRLDEAEALYREALEIGLRVRGADDPDTLIARINLGSLLATRGRLADAEPILVEAQKGYARVFGDSHQKTAEASKVLGRFYDSQGRYADSLALYEEAVEIFRRAQGDETLGAANMKDLLATALMRVGRLERAEKIIREVVDTFTRLTGDESEDTLFMRRKLAEVVSSAGRTEEARKLYEAVLEACRRTLGDDAQLTYVTTQGLGVLLMRQDRFADAEPYIRASLETGRRRDGADHPNTLIAEMNLAVVLRETGRVDEAAKLLGDTSARADRRLGDRHAIAAQGHKHYAETLSRLGRKKEAIAELEKSVAIGKAALGPRHKGPADDGLELARRLLDEGDAARAESVLEDVVSVYAEASSADGRDKFTANARLERGRARTRLGRFADAETDLSFAHGVLVEVRPAGHADIVRAERALAELFGAWNAAEPDSARAAKAAEWKTKADAAPK